MGGEGGEEGKKNGGFSASLTDILELCTGDWRLILVAFVNLLLAAVSQVRDVWVDRPQDSCVIATKTIPEGWS